MAEIPAVRIKKIEPGHTGVFGAGLDPDTSEGISDQSLDSLTLFGERIFFERSAGGREPFTAAETETEEKK